MTETIRLAKRVAEQLGCSRAEAEQYIEGGWIAVDGVATEESGARVGVHQQVDLLPDAVLAPITAVTLLLHKPVGAIATEAINPERRWITAQTQANDDHFAQHFLKRHARGLTLASPLEDSASGLLVLTQDWRIERTLIRDSSRIEQEFIVEVNGTLSPEGLALLQHGLRWNGKPLAPIKVSWQSEKRLRFALKAPERGLISHMCEQVGVQVVSMKRIRIGRISMGSLATGQWRYLRASERF